MLEGKDVLGQAQTGTGKTAAFALPVLSKLDIKQKKPQVLVLVPTRELAIQVAEAFQTYASHIKGFHVLPIYGGQDYSGQIRALKRGIQVAVGTPGRVMDHMRRGTLKLDMLKTLILDEADEMLRMGFIDDVEWILEQTPASRQIALFSATMPKEVRRIANQHLNRIEHCSECPPQLIEQIARSGATVVTQPTFTYVSGERYLSEVSPEMQPWLYPTNSLIQSGAPVAASSDAPVASPNPMIGVYSAATRKSLEGNVVGESERIPVQTALAMYTKNAARAIDEAAHVGSIEAGKLADLVLLNDDPTTIEADAIRDIRAELTLIGGRIVWQS